MKKMGRPKGDNNMEKVCSIRMDDRTLIRLEKYCKLINKGKSEIIRDAINEYVDNKDNEKES